MATLLHLPSWRTLLLIAVLLTQELPVVKSFQSHRSASIRRTPTITPIFEQRPQNSESQAPEDDVAASFLSQMARDIGQPSLLEQPSEASTPGAPPPKNDMKTRIRQWAGDYDKEATRAQLEEWIDQNPVFMLSFERCPYCQEVKSIFDSKQVQPKIVELESLSLQQYAIRSELIDMIDRTSAPAVWINGEFAGGCNDGGLGGIATLEKNGKLDGLLEEAGVLP